MSNPTLDKRIETFLDWVMSNRDTSARQWIDTIEPELKRQLKSLILEERIDELEQLMEEGETVVYQADIQDRIDQLTEVTPQAKEK